MNLHDIDPNAGFLHWLETSRYDHGRYEFRMIGEQLSYRRLQFPETWNNIGREDLRQYRAEWQEALTGLSRWPIT